MKGTERLNPGFARRLPLGACRVVAIGRSSSSLFHGSDNPNLGLIGERVNAAHRQRQSSVLPASRLWPRANVRSAGGAHRLKTDDLGGAGADLSES